MNQSKMKMEGKLLIVFLGMLMLLIIQGGIGIWITHHIIELNQHVLSTSEQIDSLGYEMFQLRLEVFHFLGTVKPDELKKFNSQIESRIKNISAILDTYPQFGNTKELFGKICDGYRKIIQLHYEFFQTKKAYELIYGESQQDFTQLNQKITQEEDRIIENAKELSKKEISHVVWIGVIISVLGLMIGVSGAFFIRRTVTRPIQCVIEGLVNAYRELVDIGTKIGSISKELVKGTSEQASALEETSSSLEQISSTIRATAENTNEANRIVKDTARVIHSSYASLEELTRSMQEISQSSEESKKIIKTIDEIAFQTNLLALNAAVEAARAGETGAGFSVVAAEVRNLAVRSADAAKNSANIIEATVKKIQTGSKVVSSVNESFAGVETDIRKLGELIESVAISSTEQSRGIEQVNQSVTSMDSVVQKNVVNGEELSQTYEKMKLQAESINSFIEQLVGMTGTYHQSKNTA